MNPENLSAADAEALLVRLIAARDHGNYAPYGYDIYLPSMATAYLEKELRGQPYPGDNPIVRALVGKFYPVAWDLCRRGILRPGPRIYGGQVVDDGQGSGYSITPFGEQWLATADRNDFLATEPGRFAQMLAPHRQRFGDAFHERAQEAMRCYGAQANLACCVMCGAAAEAILLTAAEAKVGVEAAQREYRGASGRKRIEDALFGKSNLRGRAGPYLDLLMYWRTDGAHGKPSLIAENEAYSSLALLLRFAVFVSDNWSELTAPP